jgi:hypothetical protein
MRRQPVYHFTPKGKISVFYQVEGMRKDRYSWDEIGRQCGISPRTARRYLSTDMSPEAQHERHCQSGRPSLLNGDEEAEVVRLARAARAEHHVIDNKWTRQAFADVTQGRVPNAPNSSLSRFWQRQGWPTRRVQERTPGELRDTLPAEAAAFQQEVMEYVEQHHIPPENFWVADETGMWNGSVALRTRVDPDTLDTGALRNGDNARDTGMVALNAAGGIDSYFLQHQKQITHKINGQTVVTQKQIAGMGTDEMLGWAGGFVGEHKDDGESVLILDRLGSHRNKKVLATLEAGHVHTVLLPPQASKLISPCDNSFFSAFKAEMRGMDTHDTEAKKAAFEQVIRDTPPEKVKSYFRHCKWPFP